MILIQSAIYHINKLASYVVFKTTFMNLQCKKGVGLITTTEIKETRSSILKLYT